MRTRRLLGGAAVMAALAAAPVPVAVAQLPPLPVCAPDGPCKLSAGLDDARVIDPVLAPNGERVVFIHQGENLLLDLYSVPVAGGLPVKLSVSSEESASLVAISPDSKRVLYTLPAGSGLPGDPVRRELFSVPIAGPSSARVKLAADTNTDINVGARVRVSPDGRKVVFAPPAGDRLRVVPIAGPASAGRRLTDPFVAGGRVEAFRISANSGSVVYRADQDTDGVSELYRVPLTLSPAPDPPTTKLNGQLAPGGDVDEFTIAPHDGPVIYLADQDTDAVRELYRVGLGGAGRVKLNRTLPSGWKVYSPNDAPGEDNDLPARVLPDGSRVVYEIGDVFNGRVFHQFYSVPIAGPGNASVRLDHPPLVPPGEIFALDYTISADSKRVVYTLVDQSLPGEPNLPPSWLLSVPAAGPESAGRLLAGPATTPFFQTVSPDGQRVVYSYQDNLFSQPITGGTAIRLNGTEVPRAFLRINATSTRVAYEARTGGWPALFSAPIDGNGTRYNLTESLDDASSVQGETLTPDGTRIVYTVRRDTDAPVELFSSRLVPAIVPPTP